MKRRNIILIAVICIGVISLIAGACFYMGYRFEHAGEGPKHVFEVAGDGALTDEQALSLSKEVMVLDHRFSPNLKPRDFQGRDS